MKDSTKYFTIATECFLLASISSLVGFKGADITYIIIGIVATLSGQWRADASSIGAAVAPIAMPRQIPIETVDVTMRRVKSAMFRVMMDNAHLAANPMVFVNHGQVTKISTVCDPFNWGDFNV